MARRPYRAGGYTTLVGPTGGPIEGETIQCVHCGGHWNVVPGSGTLRGFCMSCYGPHCGQEKCWNCLPHEKWLEMLEAKQPCGA